MNNLTEAATRLWTTKYAGTATAAQKSSARTTLGLSKTVIVSCGSLGPVYADDLNNSGFPIASATVPTASLIPGATLRFSGLIGFNLPNNAGRGVQLYLNGVSVGQSFPGATLGGLAFEWNATVAPNKKSLIVFSANFNDMLAPTAGQGAPYTAHTATPAITVVDLNSDFTLELRVYPKNGDTCEVHAFTVEQICESEQGYTNHARSSALLCFGDSLTAGTGSVAGSGFRLSTTGSTTSGGTAISSVASVTGVLVGMLITGPGIQPGTTVAAVSAGSITLSQNATATASGVALMIRAGSWPRQLMVADAGRPVVNQGVGGETAQQIVDRLTIEARAKSWGVVIWIGRNNVGTPTMQADVIAQIDRAIAFIGHSRYVVCTVTPATGETSSSPNGIAIAGTNAAIKTKYGTHVLDTFTILTNSSIDGQIPAQWLSDSVHFNDLGYSQLTAPMQSKLTALGMN